jgi:hypothetical protein
VAAIAAVALSGREGEAEEEAMLMAEAIRRVQMRIESSGGRLYDALSPADRELVDALNGKREEGGVDDDVEATVRGGGGEEIRGIETTPATTSGFVGGAGPPHTWDRIDPRENIGLRWRRRGRRK